MKDYSQFGEQPRIIEFFASRSASAGTKSRFLDVGAHDGVSCSNTRALAESGWGGMLVEPSPLAFSKLMTNYTHRCDVDLVCAGIVSEDTRVAKFYESGGLFVSTFDEEHRSAWEGRQHVSFNPIYIAGVTWQSLLRVLPGPYRFISIDVEGTNLALFEALASIGFRNAGAELICIEHQGHAEEMTTIAAKQGYEHFYLTEANLLLALL